MKKPDITEGEWEVQQYKNYEGFAVYAKGGGCVAERWEDSEYKNPHFEANAKAISAVPDMIEALLLAYEKRNEPFTFDDKQKIEQALKKAGCKEDA